MNVAVRSLVLALLACGGLFAILRLALKDSLRAGLLATLVSALFFFYGHVYGSLESATGGTGLGIGRHRFLVPVWLLLLALSTWWAVKKARSLPRLTTFLNAVSALALVFPLLQIAMYGARSIQTGMERQGQEQSAPALLPSSTEPLPDIYYIILDAYSRDDSLIEVFGLDNTPFLAALRERGFFVARCSQSNYSQTQLSLTSSLNLNYLAELSEDYNPPNTTRVGLIEFLHHNVARRALEELGYTSIAFETGFKGTEWEDADLYLTPAGSALEKLQFWGGVNGFEASLLRTTAVLALVDGASALPKALQPNLDNPERVYYNRTRFVLDQLARLPLQPGRKFVFAHLVIPHPPYVFDPDGEFRSEEVDEMVGYRDQVIYINKRLLTLIDEILQQSPEPPVIVLQGDHGGINLPPAKRNRILNAYYFPGGDGDSLYNGISPVNTFRVIFNRYFGGNYPLLPDISYFSVYNKPFELTVIPETRSECQ